MADRRICIHHPQFLPYVGFMARLLVADALVLLDDALYPTRNREQFKNRNRIRTPDGWAWLTIPTIRRGKQGQLISEVTIDNTQPWRRKVWGRLARTYAHARYFPAYAPFLRETFGREWARLLDLNLHLLGWLVEEMRLPRVALVRSSSLGVEAQGIERVLAICRRLGAREYLAGPMEGRRLSEEAVHRLASAGIRVTEFAWTCPPYHQCWGGFVPDLSSLDLLLNEGPHSQEVLAKGAGVP